MTRIERFEDINTWQEARKLNNIIYSVTKKRNFKEDYPFKNQIRRASISIMSNIAEGFARGTDNSFKQFLYYAHGSVAEVQSDLYVALDQKYITKKEFDKLYKKTDEISKKLMNFIKYLIKTNKITDQGPIDSSTLRPSDPNEDLTPDS